MHETPNGVLAKFLSAREAIDSERCAYEFLFFLRKLLPNKSHGSARSLQGAKGAIEKAEVAACVGLQKTALPECLLFTNYNSVFHAVTKSEYECDDTLSSI